MGTTFLFIAKLFAMKLQNSLLKLICVAMAASLSAANETKSIVVAPALPSEKYFQGLSDIDAQARALDFYENGGQAPTLENTEFCDLKLLEDNAPVYMYLETQVWSTCGTYDEFVEDGVDGFAPIASFAGTPPSELELRRAAEPKAYSCASSFLSEQSESSQRSSWTASEPYDVTCDFAAHLSDACSLCADKNWNAPECACVLGDATIDLRFFSDNSLPFCIVVPRGVEAFLPGTSLTLDSEPAH